MRALNAGLACGQVLDDLLYAPETQCNDLQILHLRGPFKNYVIPLLKVVFGRMCAKEGAFAAIMIQTT